MIRINLNKANFEYDIYNLVKAFYPSQDVKVGAWNTEEREEEETEEVCFLKGKVYYELRLLKISFRTEDGTYQEKEAEIDYENRSETKNILKRSLYELLSDFSKKELSWGTLTGIRPVKIISGLLDQGKTHQETAEFMKREYLIGDKKLQLGMEIAKKEQEIMEKVKGKYSLYVGIPFCPTTCLYCSFTSYPVAQWKDRMGEYLDALFLELDFLSEALEKEEISTIYIGGGTPTALSTDLLERLLETLESRFVHKRLLEFTVEAGRPDSLTEEKLKVLRRHPVSRISINPQTMNQKTLDFIGRHHTTEQAIRCFDMARKLGFDNINMDMILGLPGEGIDEVAHTLNEIKKLSPDNLTVHSMAVKRASRWSQMLQEQEMPANPDMDLLMDMAEKVAREMGMEPYYLYRQKNMSGNLENTGFARSGKEGIYNILIMEEKQHIFAAGAGAMTKIVPEVGKVVRIENVKDVQSYLERTQEMIERKRMALEEIMEGPR